MACSREPFHQEGRDPPLPVKSLAVEPQVVEAHAAIQQAHEARHGAHEQRAQPDVAGFLVDEGRPGNCRCHAHGHAPDALGVWCALPPTAPIRAQRTGSLSLIAFCDHDELEEIESLAATEALTHHAMRQRLAPLSGQLFNHAVARQQLLAIIDQEFLHERNRKPDVAARRRFDQLTIDQQSSRGAQRCLGQAQTFRDFAR